MTSSTVQQADSHAPTRPLFSATWLPLLAVAGVLIYLAPRVRTGADAMWMVALGDEIASRGEIPRGVPFAAAEAGTWPNVPVLGELAFAALQNVAPFALSLALFAAGAVTLIALARAGIRSGAKPLAAAAAITLAAVGMLPVLGVIRAQLLSLVPYALLVLLLRAEQRRPSWRIWMLVPLIAAWGNLHGGVLVGVALSGCYLIFSRLRLEPATAIMVGAATLAAPWLNPALGRTGAYYWGVLTNEAAARGSDMWARPDLGQTFDLLMVLAALGLGVSALRWGRVRLWEVLSIFGMAAATATSARHGMWLILFLIGPASVGLTRMAARETSPHDLPGMPQSSISRSTLWQFLTPVLTVALVLGAIAVVIGRDANVGRTEAAQIVHGIAGNKVVLAPEPLAEDLAAAGVTVWVSNPIDAFSREDQAAYLDMWLGREGGRHAIHASDLVIAVPGSPAFALAGSTGCTEIGRAADFAVLDCHR